MTAWKPSSIGAPAAPSAPLGPAASISSILRPSGSVSATMRSPNRSAGPSKSIASSAKRTIQASSPPGGTRYATALAMPGPARPGPASANGKKVRMVPGEPARSP